MKRQSWLLPLLLLGCAQEQPHKVDNPNLGIQATFPGPAKLNKRVEDTPFGPMEWFDTSYYPPQRLDEHFHVEVGNLPPGKQGGDTPEAVAATFRKNLERRLGRLEVADLPKDQGPGFAYRAPGPQGSAIGGKVVVRRGRIHHAQGTVAKPTDPRLRDFLASFQVAP